MSVRQLIGLALIASPFIAIFIFSAVKSGVLPTIGIFAGVLAVVAVIRIGVEMAA